MEKPDVVGVIGGSSEAVAQDTKSILQQADALTFRASEAGNGYKREAKNPKEYEQAKRVAKSLDDFSKDVETAVNRLEARLMRIGIIKFRSG